MIALNESTLAALRVGHAAEIVAVAGERDVARRLLEMGLTGGTEVRVERTAPLGDPIEVVLRGYRLTLRRDEARIVRVRTRS